MVDVTLENNFSANNTIAFSSALLRIDSLQKSLFPRFSDTSAVSAPSLINPLVRLYFMYKAFACVASLTNV